VGGGGLGGGVWGGGVGGGGVWGGDEEWCIGVGTGRVRGPRENRLLDTIL